VEHNRFYGADGAGIAAAGSAIRIEGNMTRGCIRNNYIQDIGRTATPAIWLDGSVTSPQIEGNRIKTDTDTGTGSAITLGAGVDDGWIAGNWASDGPDAPGQNPFVDGAATNGWSQNFSGIVAVLPA
jgi:nitrous oxidase accessory protein NosD